MMGFQQIDTHKLAEYREDLVYRIDGSADPRGTRKKAERWQTLPFANLF